MKGVNQELNNGRRKGTYITNDLLMKTVAERTSLTQPQVKECINVMFELIELFTLHPDCSQVFEFKCGDVGKLTLTPRTGRKVGTYKRPKDFGHEIIEEYVAEEEPSYQLLNFSMFPSYEEKLKEASKLRARKQKWTSKSGDKLTGWKARAGKYYSLDAEV